ncbi:MAG TPA: DUF4190 domain-containing protein [Gemmataceae bacterium]|nr:DUF4190 domain-containing protein [Gemmataceae bacterium]
MPMASNPDDEPLEAEPVDADGIQSEEDAVRETRRRRRVRRDDDYDVDIRKDIGDDAALRLLLPVGRSGWAIASGYLGLMSLICLPAPFALLTGILAILDIRRNPKKHGLGRAIFGIVMGSVGSLLLIVMLISLVLAGLRR